MTQRPSTSTCERGQTTARSWSGRLANGLSVQISVPQHRLGRHLVDSSDALLADDPGAFTRARAEELGTLAETLTAACPESDRDVLLGLIRRLEGVSRQLVFFASGEVGLANQAVAQFTGWSIPGVGEGAQRLRPRTRLYDTCDPDTLGQVCETMNFENSALLFVVNDPDSARTARQQASIVIDAACARLGADGIGPRLALLVADQSGGGEDVRALCSQIGEHGGTIVELNAAAGSLSLIGLAAGLSRGLDAEAILDGARSVVRAAAGRTEEGAVSARWSALLASALGGEDVPLGSCRQALSVAYADRLARLASWNASAWNITQAEAASAKHDPALRWSAAPQSMQGQDLRGLGLATADPMLVDIVTVSDADTLHRWAVEHGHVCRTLRIDRYGGWSYGAIVGQMMVDLAVLKIVRRLSTAAR